jgi:hypothetical protein
MDGMDVWTLTLTLTFPLTFPRAISTTHHRWCVCGCTRPRVTVEDAAGMVLGFEQTFSLEDAIESRACSLEASKRVTYSIPLGHQLSYRLTL